MIMIAVDMEAGKESPKTNIAPTTATPWEQPVRQHDSKTKSETRSRLGIVVTLMICTAIAAYLVSQYASIVSLNYTNQQLQVELSQQKATKAALQSTVYELSSPTRILTIAEQKLHMHPATPVSIPNP